MQAYFVLHSIIRNFVPNLITQAVQLNGLSYYYKKAK